jgi:uncharacterized protein (DUF2147 family)
MKKILLALTLVASVAAQAQNSIAGRWKTIDDETGKPKSIVEITEKDGVITGKIEKLFREPTEDQNPKCDKCSGDKKDQLIIGMQILSGLKKDGDNKWSGGEILDPKNGKTYSCKVELIENGQKLKLRGFIGVSLLGRTQVWQREAEVAPAPAPAVEAAPAAASTDATPAKAPAKPAAKKKTKQPK